jgi:hypothetical protein
MKVAINPMKLDDLLDKKEALQVEIVRQFLFHDGKINKQKLAKKVNLTQNALKEYLMEITLLCQPLGAYFEIKQVDKEWQLDFSSDINLDKIIMTYLRHSLAFQILEFVFKNKKFSTFQLTQEFNSSEATIFRKLRELNQVLKDFNVGIKNGQLVGDELQIRYFYYQLFLKLDTGFSSNDLEAQRLLAKLQPEFKHTFSKIALNRLSCWLFVTQHRVMVANHENKRLMQIIDKFEEDKLYQKITKLVEKYFRHFISYVGKNEGAMFYCFFISFDILGEDNFATYDLTRRKKISTALLDTYSREMIVAYYGYQRLSISDEKNLTYKLSQVHAQVLCFHGQLDFYEMERVRQYFQQFLTPEMSALINDLIGTTCELLNLPTSDHKFLWLNYANILISINLSLHKVISVAIDLVNLPSFGESLYHFLSIELSSIAQVHVEKYRPHEYYDLILTSVEQPISVNAAYYYLSEFLTPFDLTKIKAQISEIKQQKD